VLNRDLRYAEADPVDTRAQWLSYGVPEELVHAVIEQFCSTLEPYNSKQTGDITAVTNRPPGSFADWAEAHRTELLTPATW
jgi:(4-alkanoyl-5-oxo-2,5-dihydrofuran-3-yl)methyl phosphate reductase